MLPGKVYLVGAGPGHPELLTIKAAELIRDAEIIVYDRLVQEEVLGQARPEAERIYVGKAPGRHESRQPEINQILLEAARRAEAVVRLKGGDALLFSRGGEEAEFLAGHGIAVDVIPGVSSALAAPACAGIPITHRDVGSTVCIVTGHEREDCERSRIDWAALARIDTLVVLMGVHNLDRIAGCLMLGGKSGSTPAALIQMAYWADEQVVVATLETLAEAARLAGAKPPATLVIGETVRVRERLRTLQRDLRRQAAPGEDGGPGPPADDVLRFQRAAAVAKLLRAAIAVRLFDLLEVGRTAEEVAGSLGIPLLDASQLLEALAAERLLRRSGDGFRNAEAASRYLRAASPRFLGDRLCAPSAATAHLERLAGLLAASPAAAHLSVTPALDPGCAPSFPRPTDPSTSGPLAPLDPSPPRRLFPSIPVCHDPHPARPARRDYPVNLRLFGKPVLVVGGGEVAARKVERLLRCAAGVRLVSPELGPRLRALVDEGRVEHRARPFREDDATGAFVVFAATDDRQANAQVARVARARGALVNAADDPESCDFTLPACVERGELTVAVSTGGVCPAVARWLRRRLEQVVTPSHAALLEVAGDARRRLMAAGRSPAEISRRLASALDCGLLEQVERGDAAAAEAVVLAGEADGAAGG